MFAHQKTPQDIAADSLLYPAAQVYDWGSTLVISPQPNSEVLGCGGAMALLRQLGFRVHVLFVSESEAAISKQAKHTVSEVDICRRIERVGVSDEATVFLDLRKGHIPQRGEAGFEEAVRLLQNELESFQPDTILLPFLDQGNQDVQATWQLARQAACQSYYPVRMVEYRLWSWSGASLTVPRGQSKTWRLDIKQVIDQKIKALEGHWESDYQFPWRNAEQELLVHQANPWEVYVEYASNEAFDYSSTETGSVSGGGGGIGEEADLTSK